MDKSCSLNPQILRRKNIVSLNKWQDVKGKVFTGHFQFLNFLVEGKIPRSQMNMALPFDGTVDFNFMFIKK